MDTCYEMTGAFVPFESFNEVLKLFLNEYLWNFQTITCHNKSENFRVKENMVSKYLLCIHLPSLSYSFYHVCINGG